MAVGISGGLVSRCRRVGSSAEVVTRQWMDVWWSPSAASPCPYGGAARYEFATSEYWQTALRPRLQVLVDVTTPAPPSPTPTATSNPSCVVAYLETEASGTATCRWRSRCRPRASTSSGRARGHAVATALLV